MPIELLIIGTGGLAREAAQLARQADPTATHWSRISFVAEDPAELGRCLGYGDVRFTDADLDARTEPADIVIGIGHPRLRRAVALRLSPRSHLGFPNLIHPSVEIDASSVCIGRGNLIAKGVVMTCNIEIGDFNLFNWNATVGHDVKIGSYNVVNPGCNLSGHVVVADACLLGTGTQVIERQTIASEVVVGAGAVVTRPLTESGTYVGIPARRRAC